MDYIKGISFTSFFDCRGNYCSEEVKKSMKQAKESLGLSHITLCFLAYQDTAHSVEIDYKGSTTPAKAEVIELIEYAKSLGLQVILKPMLDCKDGTWRAHINFFDVYVPCEPKWEDWFRNYTEYIVEYAKIAEEAKAEMIVIGTEMVQTERRESDWIMLINEVRKVYSGLITYNTDKYQEDNVKWWKHVDVISASGYYPYDDIENQINRIEQFARRYNKPYFFAECGCPCRIGSKANPNDWSFVGDYSLDEQKEWIEKFIEVTRDREWLYGYSWWAWSHDAASKDKPELDDGYDVYKKPAADIIKAYYETIK